MQSPGATGLDSRQAALRHCSLIKVVPISKRGTITLPPPFRKKMRLDQVDNPVMLVEERDGKLIMELAAAVPVRGVPEETIKDWVGEDEADGAAVRRARKKGGCGASWNYSVLRASSNASGSAKPGNSRV